MGKLTETCDGHFTMLLWGPPKSGKTVLASQFPNPVFIDLDNGVSSVRALRNSLSLTFDFDVFQLDESTTDDADFIEHCGKTFATQSCWIKTKKLVEILCRKLSPNHTVVLDNISRLSEVLVAHIMKTSGRNPIQIQDWMTFTNEISILCSYIKSSTPNVILIGHEEYDKDELDRMRRFILMPTKMRYRVPSIVSDYLYMTSKTVGAGDNRKIKRYLQVMPDSYATMGSRALIPDMEQPTYAKMRPFLSAALNRDLGEPTWTPPEQ